MSNSGLYIMDETWQIKIKKHIKSFYQTIFLGTPLFALINVAFSSSMTSGTHISFFTFYVLTTTLTTAYCIYFPLKAIKRYKNLIRSLQFEKTGQLTVTTIDDRILKLTDYQITEITFRVGNAEKQGKSISNKNNGAFYTLIPGFYSSLPVIPA